MADFYISISRDEIALQISTLINNHNKLCRKHTASSILRGGADYFVEVIGNKIIGCVGLFKKHITLSEIRHLCITPIHRRRGIAKNLITLAIANCDTENVYMVIRDDNIPSLITAKSLGFVPIKKDWRSDHYIITVGRKKNYAITG